MKKKWKALITFGVVLILIAGFYFFTDWFSLITGYLKGEDRAASLALCLSNHGAEFYGSPDCEDCKRTKEMFGMAFALVNSVECGNSGELCPNVREVPAWFIGGEMRYGFLGVEELERLSGCV